MSIREGPEELTLRTEEVGSKKKKSVHQCRSHCGGTGGDRLRSTLIGMRFCQAIHKGIGLQRLEGIVRALQRNE